MNAAIALCAAVALPAFGNDVPQWVHLLPAGQVRTVDGRGPYIVSDMAALASASLKAGQKLPIDENHATDKGAVLGLPAPARGWIVALECRESGLWGKVEWTAPGRQLMVDKAYVGISPAVLHTKDNRVVGVLRASLTNTPNLQGLTTLHSAEPVRPRGLDATDRLIMHTCSLSEDEYRAAIEPVRSSGLDATDRLIMHTCSLSEDEYRAAIAKDGLKIGG